MTSANFKVSFDGWELEGSRLSPTRSRLQAHSQLISSQTTDDPLVTFVFPEGTTLTIHRCLLLATDGPLHALISSPFLESKTNIVTSHDSYETINVIRDFLYCLPVDLAYASNDLPLVAHRWEIHLLLNACLGWAELAAPSNSAQFVETWMTFLSLIQPPPRFCTFFTRVITTDFKSFANLLKPLNWMWGTSNVWHIFHEREMLSDIVHKLVRFAPHDYSLTLLDVVLSQLENVLSDHETSLLLAQFDWASASCIEALNSQEAEKWSKRAWRQLALTPTPARHFSGEDLRMQWCRAGFGYDSMDLPVCSSSEDYHFHGLSFSITFQAWCWAQPVSVSIKLNHTPASKLQQMSKLRVSASVCAIEDQCTCGLRLPSSDTFEEYQGQLLPCIENELTVNSFANKGGVEFILMDYIQFAKWRRRHKDCGLLICARLRMYPDTPRRFPLTASNLNIPTFRPRSRDLDTKIPWQINCPCADCRLSQNQPFTRGHTSFSRLQIQP